MQKLESKHYVDPEANISIWKTRTQGHPPMHTHGFLELVYVTGGSATHYIGEVSYPIGRGDLLFINYGQAHTFSSQEGVEYVNLLLRPEFIAGELIHSENAFEMLALSQFEEFGGAGDEHPTKVTFTGEALLEVEFLIRHMIAEYDGRAPGFKTALKGYTYVLLTKVFRRMQEGDGANVLRHISRITPDILKYIEENCFENLTLSEMARKCYYNHSYFSRVFKEAYGKTLTEYKNEKRVQEAMRLLAETDLTVEDIMRRVGYGAKKQFYQQFKRIAGITPAEYRRQSKK